MSLMVGPLPAVDFASPPKKLRQRLQLNTLARRLFSDHLLADQLEAEILQIVSRTVVPPQRAFSEADVILEIDKNELTQPGTSPFDVVERFLDDQLGEAVSTLHLHEDATELAHWATSHAASHWQPPDASPLHNIAKLSSRYRFMVDLDVRGIAIEHPWYRLHSQGDQRFAQCFVTGPTGVEFRLQNPDVLLFFIRSMLCCAASGISGFFIKNATNSASSADRTQRANFVAILECVLSMLGNNYYLITDTVASNKKKGAFAEGTLSLELRTAQREQLASSFVAYLQSHDAKTGVLIRHVDNRAGETQGFDVILRDESQVGDRALDFAFLPQAVALGAGGVPSFRLGSLLGRAWPYSGMHAWTLDGLESLLLNPWSREARMFERFFALLMLRISHPAFHPSAEQHLLALHSDVIAIRRVDKSCQRPNVLFIANLSDTTIEVPLPWGRSFDLLLSHVYGSTFPIRPYGYAVLEQR